MNKGKIAELLQNVLHLKHTFKGITAWIEEGANPYHNNFLLFSNQLSVHSGNPIIKKNVSTKEELLEIYKHKTACIREEELTAQNYIYKAIAEKYGRTPINKMETFEHPERSVHERTGTKYELYVYQETGERRIRVKIKDYQLDDDDTMQTINLEEFTI